MPSANRAKPAGPGLRAVAILPCRIGSQRLPRKMLLAQTGRCLFEHTALNAAASGVFERVIVATDDGELLARAQAAGLEAVMTRTDHASGTDRIFEAARALGLEGVDVLVNVQGDEPELAPEDLARLVAAFGEVGVEIATLCGPIASEAEAAQPQVVKVVRDSRGDALYFSRARIPAPSHARAPAGEDLALLRRHVGVYAFRPAALARFCGLGPGRLELAEKLEQLRWLESGGRIRVLETAHVPLGIDTRADYDAFVERIRSRAPCGPPPSRGGRA
jgi:3-deoxy-manno-octulosonate cytidylyltransferase (CMP-KDO synthetase)